MCGRPWPAPLSHAHATRPDGVTDPSKRGRPQAPRPHMAPRVSVLLRLCFGYVSVHEHHPKGPAQRVRKTCRHTCGTFADPHSQELRHNVSSRSMPPIEELVNKSYRSCQTSRACVRLILPQPENRVFRKEIFRIWLAKGY